MFSLIPGGQRIKKYIYRMILGVLLLPLGGILLIWNEYKAINQVPVFEEYPTEWVYWGFRLAGFFILLFCFQRIFSFIKLFMMKIPLTYNEIRAGIWITATIFSMATFLVILSICWIYAKPMISYILLGAGIALLFLLLIRKRQQKKIEKSKIPSVKPQQAKDV